jgi:hypothetical protein
VRWQIALNASPTMHLFGRQNAAGRIHRTVMVFVFLAEEVQGSQQVLKSLLRMRVKHE